IGFLAGNCHKGPRPKPEIRARHGVHQTGSPSRRPDSSRAPGSALPPSDFAVCFLAFNTTPSTTAAGTAASSAYFTLVVVGRLVVFGTTHASCEWSISFPML